MVSDGFGSYCVVGRIGRGSAGTVYMGEYGALRRPIAVKVLHDHLVADGSADRMLAEARALSVLDHPGIVKVLDCGMTHDGRAYIVMEYLAGELLHQRLRRGALTEARVVMFARQLASALEVAHAAGIIHRDVKPENAVVIPDPDVPGGERIKLLDFGIAKCGDQERTDTGVVLGTPAYMAPEQFAASRRVDHRVDIYALGVVMYVMATGTLPFVGDDTDELRAEHSYCRPRPVTESGVSDRLSEIVDRCLAKDPHDRFTSMAQLGAALRELELEGVTDRARSELGATSDAQLDELDAIDTAATEPKRVVTPGVHVPPPGDLDVRAAMPWRTVLGVLTTVAIALLYVLIADSGSRDVSSPPGTVVEREAVPASEPAPVPPIARDAAPPVERAVLEPRPVAAGADQRRSEPPRARPRAARREPMRTDATPARTPKLEAPSEAAGPEARVSTKEEDYASVTPPTLY